MDELQHRQALEPADQVVSQHLHSLGGQQQFNYDGIRNDLQGSSSTGWMPNYWNVRTFSSNPTVYDDRSVAAVVSGMALTSVTGSRPTPAAERCST
jgi:hypothetical protein